VAARGTSRCFLPLHRLLSTHGQKPEMRPLYTSALRGSKDPQLPNISAFMNQPYPLRALRTRKWGV
jgi:hypothetical protein